MNGIDAIFEKGFRQRLTLKLVKSDNITEHADKQLFHATLRLDHCLNELVPPRKNYFDRNLRKNGQGLELLLAKTERLKSSFVITCIYRFAQLYCIIVHYLIHVLYYG